MQTLEGATMRHLSWAFALAAMLVTGCAPAPLQQNDPGLPAVFQGTERADTALRILEYDVTNPNLVSPFELAFSKDGALWFTPWSPHLGLMRTAGKFEWRDMPKKRTPIGPERADWIAMGPDGQLWFTDYYGETLGTVTPFAHIKQFHVFSQLGGYSADVVSGPNDHLWVTLSGDYTNLVELDTTPKVLNVYRLNGAYQEAIAAGPGDTLWIGGSARYQVITRFFNGKIHDFPVTTAAGIGGIAAGPDGNMWFTGVTDPRLHHYIAKITPRGKIFEYRIQSEGADIIAGPDGKMWFTEPYYGLIGKVTMTGVVSEYKIPHAIKGSKTQYQVAGIVAGPDGNLWFTEPMHSRIGEVVLAR